ncbi:MAG: nuclear transport factor 2 family protein, partial [Balneolaceae bacterium]|nr:nuclear transport factor 2 family protein [Balneolaceae bacterium]
MEESLDRVLQVGFCLVPYQDLSDIIDPDVMLFGTTKDEQVFSLQETTDFLKSQYEQMEGITPSIHRNRLYDRLFDDQDSAIIAEEYTLNLKSDESVNSIHIRASSVWHYSDDRWIMTHWHASSPVDTENDHWHQEEWKREKEKLQKLVDQQTADLKRHIRELEIESALERVRARSMGMQSSDELHQVINIVSEQLTALDIEFDTANFIEINEDGSWEIWIAVEGQHYAPKIHVPYYDCTMMNEMVNAMKKGVDLFQNVFSREEKNDFFTHFFTNTVAGKIAEERKQYVFDGETNTVSIFATKSPALGISKYTPDPFTDEENEIFRRFANVFEQAYTRFLDLQKAEEQAREKEIEAALERVRAKGMAMQSTNDIESATAVVFNELSRLGIEFERCGICLMNETPIAELWSTTLSQVKNEVVDIVTGKLDFRIHPLTQQSYNDWKENKEYSSFKLVGDELKEYYSIIQKQPDYKFPEVIDYPDQQILHSFFFSAGTIFVYTQDVLTEITKDVFKRFTKVFEQTYTRFLDLKRAEEQAREAEIQLSLERVRARSMSMQQSDELHDVLSLLFEQFDVLGIKPANVFLSLFDKEDRTLTYRATGTGGSRTQGQQTVSLDSLDVWKQLFEKWKNDNSDSVEVIYYEKEILPTLFSLLDETFSSMPEDERLTIDQFPEGGYTAHGYTPFGYIGFNHERPPTEEEKEILTKFASEFSRVYQRFLDIQKAEERARESQIETALERVRARTMAMHNSSELSEVASVLFKEISLLTNTPDRFNIAIVNEEDRSFTVFLTDHSGHQINKQFTIKADSSPVIAEFYECWENNETVNIQDLHGEKLKNWIHYMGNVVGIPFNMDNVKEHRFISSVFFSHGFIGTTTHEVPGESTIAIVKRFASVFQQTYVRFLDLKKAEALALETARQASLDRIRAEIGYMRSSEDLQQITPIIWDELNTLKIPFIRCGVFLLDEENDLSHTYLSTSKGEPIAALHLPLEGISLVENLKEAWKKREIFTVHWDEDDFREWTQNLIDRGFISSKKKYEAGSAPTTLDLHFLPFKHGMLYIGNTEPLSDKHLDLGQSIASAFSVAYDRYEDFNNLEQAKKKIEEAFEELEAAQDQLVQQE